METYVQIAQVLALLSVSALCVYLIITLIKANSVIEAIQKDVAEVASSLKPVLENLSTASDKLRSITTKVDDQVLMFRDSFSSMKRMVDHLEEFEIRLMQQIEEPVSRVASLIGTIIGRIISYVGSRPADKHEE